MDSNEKGPGALRSARDGGPGSSDGPPSPASSGAGLCLSCPIENTARTAWAPAASHASAAPGYEQTAAPGAGNLRRDTDPLFRQAGMSLDEEG
jgi:hypothetical protein